MERREDPLIEGALDLAWGLWAGLGVSTWAGRVVQQCIDAGIVKGEEVALDGTMVDANAATTSLEPSDASFSYLSMMISYTANACFSQRFQVLCAGR